MGAQAMKSRKESSELFLRLTKFRKNGDTVNRVTKGSSELLLAI
jgi:hypothetical protein